MAELNPIPEGFHSLTPQLTVANAGDAIALYEKAFGAVVRDRAPDPTGKKVWHAALRIGDSTFFVNDAFPEMGGNPPQPASLWFYTKDVDAAFKRATDAGLTVASPLADMFWGDRTGTLVDKFGIRWTLGEHKKNVTPEELAKITAEMAAKTNEKK